MFEQAENMHEGDVFVLAGNRCTVEHICHQNGRTRIAFSFLDNPDYGGILVLLSDTEFSVMLDHRSNTRPNTI